MGRQLYHRAKDDKYAIWSTIVDDYITPWTDKATVRAILLADMVEDAIYKTDKFMEKIDEEVV